MKSRRIENLEFRQATYLLPKSEYPKHPSWCIDYWYPNSYYGRENEFIKDVDNWYLSKDGSHRVHKNCFENPESCFAIASFDYDEGEYELHFVSNRPLELTKEEREIFWKLIEYGDKQLNNTEE